MGEMPQSSPPFFSGRAAGSVVAQIEQITATEITGWVVDVKNPAQIQSVLLVIDGLGHTTLRPHIFRPEIAQHLGLSKKFSTPLGFTCRLPSACKDNQRHEFEIRDAAGLTALGPAVSYRYPKAGQPVTTESLQHNKELLPNLRSRRGSSRKSHPKSLHRAQHQTRPKVSVVILNRNGADHLRALFLSWLRFNTVPAELIVIDHASGDHSQSVCAQFSHLLSLRWVGRKTNYSFSDSSNAGARLARAPSVLFLNNDTVLVQDILPPMLDTLKDPSVCAVGVKLLLASDALLSASARINNKTLSPVSRSAEQIARLPIQHLGVGLTLSGHRYWPHEVTAEDCVDASRLFSCAQSAAVTAACMLVDKEEFLAAGGFRSEYFYGYEDVDYCFTQSMGRQKKIICRNDLTVLHAHGATRLTGKEPAVLARQLQNQKVFAKRFGLWAKLAYWDSLAYAKNFLADDTLCVGLLFSDTTSVRQSRLVNAWAESVVRLHPHATVLWLNPEHGDRNVSLCHVLLVFSYEVSLKLTEGLRADARVLAVIQSPDEESAWATHPDLGRYSGALRMYRSAKQTRGTAPLSQRLLTHTYRPASPFGDLLAARIRVLITYEDRADTPLAIQIKARAIALGLMAQLAGPEDQLTVAEIRWHVDRFGKAASRLGLSANRKTLASESQRHERSLRALINRVLNPEAIDDQVIIFASQKSARALNAHQNQEQVIRSTLIQAVDTVKRRVGHTFHTP